MTNMRYGCSGRRKTRFLSLHMNIVQRSFEGDELSFLYCSLLIILDSILYGLMALIVTKVILLMIMMVMLSTPGKVWKSKKSLHAQKHVQLLNHMRQASRLDGGMRGGKGAQRQGHLAAQGEDRGIVIRDLRKEYHLSRGRARVALKVPAWLLRLSGQRIIVMCCSLSRGSTPPSKRARSRLCWATTGLARAPRSA